MNKKWDKMIGDFYIVCFDKGDGDIRNVTGTVEYFNGQRLVLWTEKEEMYVIKFDQIITMIPQTCKNKESVEFELLGEFFDKSNLIKELSDFKQVVSSYEDTGYLNGIQYVINRLQDKNADLIFSEDISKGEKNV